MEIRTDLEFQELLRYTELMRASLLLLDFEGIWEDLRPDA